MLPFPFASLLIYIIAESFILSMSYIDEQVREKAIKVDNAFKYRIEQAKTNAIDVGIFDVSTNILAKMTIESEGEIPDEVKNDVMNWHYL